MTEKLLPRTVQCPRCLWYTNDPEEHEKHCSAIPARRSSAPTGATREEIARIIDGYADSYRMMANEGDGKVLASSVHTDLLCNIKPAILALSHPRPACACEFVRDDMGTPRIKICLSCAEDK